MLSKRQGLQPDIYFSNSGDPAADLNRNTGRSIDIYIEISLQPHK